MRQPLLFPLVLSGLLLGNEIGNGSGNGGSGNTFGRRQTACFALGSGFVGSLHLTSFCPHLLQQLGRWRSVRQWCVSPFPRSGPF
jgi:hypothetical protein